MRILVFSWRDPKHPLAGGAEQVMHEHMKGWIEGGHEVTLFSSKLDILESEEILDKVKIVRRGYQYLGVQIHAFFYWMGHKAEYDLVVDQFHGIPFFTPLYVRKPKLAVLQEVTREVWFKNPLPIPLNWIVGALGFISEPFVFLFYRKVPFMVGSNSAKEDLVKMKIPERNILTVPHGVIIKKLKKTPKKEKVKTVMFLGALTKDKGIEDAIQCLEILSKNNNFQFWIVGKPETVNYELKIRNTVERLGLTRKVKFWGFVDQQRKFELLARAHVLVNPSVREGWGLVNIEANAMGTPVVAYRSPGLVDSVLNDKTGIVVAKNTPEQLAKEILNLFEDDIRLRRFQKMAVSWSRSFSWKKSREKSMNYIQTIK